VTEINSTKSYVAHNVKQFNRFICTSTEHYLRTLDNYGCAEHRDLFKSWN